MVARYAEEAGVDEVIAVARTAVPALTKVADGTRVHLVTADNPAASIASLVKLGLDRATGDILLLAYSDDTFAPRDVGKFLVYLRDADMVVGTRTTRQMIEQGNNMRGIVRVPTSSWPSCCSSCGGASSAGSRTSAASTAASGARPISPSATT